MVLILTTLAKFNASSGTGSLDEWLFGRLPGWLQGWLA